MFDFLIDILPRDDGAPGSGEEEREDAVGGVEGDEESGEGQQDGVREAEEGDGGGEVYGGFVEGEG